MTTMLSSFTGLLNMWLIKKHPSLVAAVWNNQTPSFWHLTLWKTESVWVQGLSLCGSAQWCGHHGWGGGPRVTWCPAHRPLYLQSLTGGHCVPLFFLALTSQPWLTWFVVAPRSEGGSWIMSSYSLRGGPRLVDYRIALTDQRELWLLSNSPHKER